MTSLVHRFLVPSPWVIPPAMGVILLQLGRSASCIDRGLDIRQCERALVLPLLDYGPLPMQGWNLRPVPIPVPPLLALFPTVRRDGLRKINVQKTRTESIVSGGSRQSDR
ncbi:hypothetical protein E1B28_003782 [Marasmius oreades]|uniref:Uncharacterized protein n=1 Tax=Marasmius oreades TaxID=181124 RepID=A0A9P7UX99_9AGAR|nr:uncharacterized protein E1B28_003782 [Marasmius oreades]KAG7096338.1 hypothetical protein E1B28_003782 [Marasmius oreades]